MADPVDGDQWSTIRPFLRGYPAWVGEPDRTRIAAYQTYEQIYWNEPAAFKLIQRGDDANPIYIPAPKVIVESLHRYLANGMIVTPDPNSGSSAEQQLAMETITNLFRRERFFSGFESAKRFGIIHGDWLFYLWADPERLEGSRITIKAIDPGSYFPIWDPDSMDDIIGCHIVEQVVKDGKPYIDRSTYRKTTEKGGPSPITFERGLYKVDEWGGPDMDEGSVQKVITALYQLPAPIDQLPTYHIRNFVQPGSDFGSSELRGTERLLAAINQAISDEELSLVLDGLGVYSTDAGSPVDEATGLPTDWRIGPGRVVEKPPGSSFERVAGIGTVAPFGEHLKYLHEQLDLGSGTVAPAKGQVDVAVAESGVALMIQMGPMLSRAAERETPITDTLVNMLYDLKSWFIAYERIDVGAALWVPRYGDKLPINRKERFTELMTMLASPTALVSAAWVRKELSKLGYEFDDDTTMLMQILDEKQAVGALEADVFGDRMDQELATMTEDPNLIEG